MLRQQKSFSDTVYVEIKHPVNRNGDFERERYCEIGVISAEGEVLYSAPINYISSSLIPSETLNYYGKYRGDYQNALGAYHVARKLAHHIKDKFVIGWGKHTNLAIQDLLSDVLDEDDKPVYIDYRYIDVAEMVLPEVGIRDFVALRHVSKALGVSYENLSRNIELYLGVLRDIHLSLQDRDYLKTLPTFKSAVCMSHLEEETNKLGYSLHQANTTQEDSLTDKEPQSSTLNADVNQAKKIVDEIIADLIDRRGLKHEWYAIDEDIQEEIHEAWTNIILANTTQSKEG